MKNTVWLISLEPIPTRYTGQWHTGIKEQLELRAKGKFNIVQIDGLTNSGKPTEGAFLDFVGTNMWKSEQAIEFFNRIQDGSVQKGDKVLFTDAWNPTIIQLKYISDLMGLELQLHGIWHAGSYDPQDFLGRLIQDKRWTRNTERAIFHSLDLNYYATDFHINLFVDNVFAAEEDSQDYIGVKHKVVRSGQPHEKLLEVLEPYYGAPVDKENIILFPHRLAPEKQPELFRILAEKLPQYEFIICQEQELTKDEYHDLLKRAKVVFSANLQETLGISAMEAIKCGTIPMLPKRLSYTEMYEEEFLYPSRWTEPDRFEEHLDFLILKLTDYMENFNNYYNVIGKQLERLNRDYLSGDIMYEKLLS